MKIYIVRHGKVLSNVLQQYNTADEDLIKLGIVQTKELRNKIKNIKFDIIICSPMVRTKHTANIINVNNKKIIYDDSIEERNCGNLSGKSLEVTNREEYWNYYTDIQYGTSENIQEFFNRVYGFLEKLKEKQYKSILIVTYSGVSKVFNEYFEGIQDDKFLNRGLKNC